MNRLADILSDEHAVIRWFVRFLLLALILGLLSNGWKLREQRDELAAKASALAIRYVNVDERARVVLDCITAFEEDDAR